MSPMKKAGVAAACLLLALCLSGCGDLWRKIVFAWMATDDDRVEKSEIFAYVQENEDSLLDCIGRNDYSAVLGSPVIRRIDTHNGYIDFDCGGAGMGPETSYRGFFYSEQDNLRAIWCAPREEESLSAKGKGYFWKESGGDNTYYVEHICGHFYYYDAEF